MRRRADLDKNYSYTVRIFGYPGPPAQLDGVLQDARRIERGVITGHAAAKRPSDLRATIRQIVGIAPAIKVARTKAE